MAEIHIPTSRYEIAKSPERQRTARRRLKTLTPPSAGSLELAEHMARRVYNRSAQIRRGFVARERSDVESTPPMADILRSGRGGTVRLRLYLTIIWIAAGPPHRVRAAAQAWAILLDLPDPATKGARQIRSGLRWLRDRELVALEEVPGVGSTVTLMSDLGTGDDYRLPGLNASQVREAGGRVPYEDLYVKLPDTFWTLGWIHLLSGPAIAMLLVLLDARRGGDERQELWFSQAVADQRYLLSEETRAKGFAELEAFELISVRKRSIGPAQLDAPRIRHTYVLHLDRLGELPLDGVVPERLTD